MKNVVHHRKCDRCGMKYELLEHRRWNGDGYDEPTLHAQTPGVPDDFLDCPRCKGDQFHLVIGTPNLPRVQEDPTPYLVRAPNLAHENQLSQSHFPYFDHGLGMMLQSPEHREWAKTHYKDGAVREEPLVWVGNELPWQPSDIVDREIAHTRDVQERYAAYKDEMMAHPDTRRAWDWVETATANQDFSALGAPDDFFGPQNYPPEGETLMQDESGHLYTESGWESEHPQPWVPTALQAAGLPPLLPGAPGPHLIEAEDAATA